MFSAPRLLTGPESLLLAGTAAVVGAVLAARFGRWSSSRARSAGAIAAALVASTLVVAPVTAWAVISDIRASHRLSGPEAERIGAEMNGLDTSLVDRIRELIPRDATYAVTSSDQLDSNRRSVFRVWSLSALLPRMAVAELPSSDWIVSWGVAPADLEVAVTDVHVIDPRRASDPPVYVARVMQ